MQETAYAKINLALHVRGREPNGYHRIETIFAFCEHGDVLTATEADVLSLEVTGPFAGALEGESDNLVLQAARALGRTVAFKLEKNLPVAAGLGGGSADAAAALRMFGGGVEIAARLGADVPACLSSRTSRGTGKGDEIEPVEIAGLSGAPVLLVNPGVPLSTAAVFRAWDGVDRGPLCDWMEGRNDLQAAAIGLVPEIADALDALSGARVARMSGSGATCFGLYDSEGGRDADAARIAAARPGWWVCQTGLR
jgi:4-diphosphocytidyl-2-C-methyl-D-erythritol kinase